jgi:hypothetical protein
VPAYTNWPGSGGAQFIEEGEERGRFVLGRATEEVFHAGDVGEIAILADLGRGHAAFGQISEIPGQDPTWIIESRLRLV